jgi:predicted metal-dependent hydrolase
MSQRADGGIHGEVTFEGMRVPYEIVTSARRRKAQIAVIPDRGLVVRLPVGVPFGVADLERELARNAPFFRAALSPEAQQPSGLRAVQTPEGLLTFSLVRRRGRRRVAIHVLPDRTVEVRAPLNASTEWIDGFVAEHAEWIRQRQADLPGPTRHATGTRIPFQGQALQLEVLPGLFEADEIRRKGDRLIVRVGNVASDADCQKAVQHVLRRWLSHQARDICRARVPFWTRKIGLSPGRVTIKDMSSRWGSCSARGNVSISYRIVMAPPWVMDYLLVHELCHLRHMNHSADFWAAVREVFPRVDEARRWLREHSAELTV